MKNKPRVKRFVIDRTVWLRGLDTMPENDDDDDPCSYLLRKCDGLKCCLGIYLSQCGMSDGQLTGKNLPSACPRLPEEAEWLTAKLSYTNSSRLTIPASYAQVEDEFADVNDSRDINEQERESKVKEMFAAQGIKVSFKGKRLPSRFGKTRKTKGV